MKLIAEKVDTDNNEPWRIFLKDDQGKHRVDLSLYSIFLTPSGSDGDVELTIFRPSGILDRLFGERKRLYLQIKLKSGGRSVKRWLCSDDQGHSWGPIKRMSVFSTDTIDKLTIKP